MDSHFVIKVAQENGRFYSNGKLSHILFSQSYRRSLDKVWIFLYQHNK